MTRDASGIQHRLAALQPIAEPVALVVAHPDDELVGLGSRLMLFERLTLVHLTDGAPLDMADARRAGFHSRAAYAFARQAESAEGLARAWADPVRRLRYDIPDQTLVDRLPEVARRLVADLAGQAAVFTHAYEGGHPDHDAAALAVQVACEHMAHPPVRLEFAGYFEGGGVRRVNVFHPDPAHPATTVELSPEARARKADAYAAHASQAATLALFPPEREGWRAAPTYDFTRPPPSGEVLYDGYGWTVNSAVWRERAQVSLEAASLKGAFLEQAVP